MKKYFPIILGLVFAPFLASAAVGVDAFYLLGRFQTLLNFVIPFIITIGVIYFIWGVIQYTMGQDEEAKKDARKKIIGGLIGLFVIVSFWGIVNLIVNTTQVGPTAAGPLPCIPDPVTKRCF